jgi:hypothetical protein
MDREEARIILSAYRPGRDDAADPVFAPALALLDQDGELADWFANQHALDLIVQGAVQSIEPPADLKASILASAKTIPLPASRTAWQFPVWLAAAAAVALLAGAAFLIQTHNGPKTSLAAIDEAIPKLTRTHEHPFATDDGDVGKIRSWLAGNGGDNGFVVPRGLKGIQGMGCEVTAVNGAKVSILCFELHNGGAAHLYVMDRSQLENPPPDLKPEFQERDGIAMASWSDGRHSYILAMPGSDSDVRALL